MLQHTMDALSTGSLYALLALGIALIYGIMRLANFAHGELIMAGAYVIFFLADVPWPLVVAAALGTAMVLALVMERLAFRPIRAPTDTTLLITSFAISFLIQNVVLLIFGARAKSVAFLEGLGGFFDVGGVRIARLDVVTVLATLTLLTGLAVFLKRALVGIQMRAAAEDFDMARLLGVRARRVVIMAFALSGLLAGVASILLVVQTGTVSPAMGLQPVLIAFIATILGGLGSLGGAVVGGYLFGSVTVGFQALLPLGLRPYRDAFAFAVIIVVLLWRPQGLAGKPALEEEV